MSSLPRRSRERKRPRDKFLWVRLHPNENPNTTLVYWWLVEKRRESGIVRISLAALARQFIAPFRPKAQTAIFLPGAELPPLPKRPTMAINTLKSSLATLASHGALTRAGQLISLDFKEFERRRREPIVAQVPFVVLLWPYPSSAKLVYGRFVRRPRHFFTAPQIAQDLRLPSSTTCDALGIFLRRNTVLKENDGLYRLHPGAADRFAPRPT